MKKIALNTLMVAALIAPAAVGFAQFGSPMADTSAMSTLDSGPVGSASGSFDPIGRARAAAGAPQASSDPFAQPSDPFGGGGGAQPAGGDPFGGGGKDGGAPNPFGGAAVPAGGANLGFSNALANIAKLSALGGERIVCHRTGQILQDAREISILVTASGSYYDDGKNGNDAVANDNIYTNITINNNYISPESHVVQTKLIQTLQYASNLRPQQFSLVRVASTEPLAPFPKIVDLETSQDASLKDWAVRFLRDYRVEPDKIDGEFYPTFLPAPPRAPNIPLPITFTPENAPARLDANGKPVPSQPGAQPNAINGQLSPEAASASLGVTADGQPVGNAQSRYF
ncbi:hypothetical protein BH09SUM1_BH09SUM1_25050 [soil metagenome]